MVRKIQIMALSSLMSTWMACSPEGGKQQQGVSAGMSIAWADADEEEDSASENKDVVKKSSSKKKTVTKKKSKQKDDVDKKIVDEEVDDEIVNEEPSGTVPQIAGLVAMTANLADAVEQNGTVMVPDDYVGGNIQLSILRTDLDGLDSTNTISVTVEPAMVEATPGAVVDFKLSVETTSMAPSFAAGVQAHFQIVMTDVDSQKIITMKDVPLEVKADLIVQMMGGASPETWSSEEDLSVRPHEGGLRIRFVNMDGDSTHVVHGQGAINHGDIGNPLAQGDEYEQVIMPGDGQGTAVYYCHNHESGANQRRINVNVAP
ncbi:MAG: hypothetical protein AB8C84_10325 [Oligoflexales bacterium]